MKGFLQKTLSALAGVIVACSLPAMADADCDATTGAIADLQVAARQHQHQAQQIESLARDEGLINLNLDRLEDILTSRVQAPAYSSDDEFEPCQELQEDFDRELKNVEALAQRVGELQASYWLQQPDVSHRALLSVWRSRQRLVQHRELVLARPDIAGNSELVQQLDEIEQRLHRQRLAFLEQLPSMTDAASPRQVVQWIQLWQQSLELPGQASGIDPALASTLDDGSKALLKIHLRITELDALVMTNVINNERSLLWKTARQDFMSALQQLKLTAQDVVKDEVLALGFILRWLYVDALVDFRPDGRAPVFQRVFYGFEYLVGLASFVVLAYLAKKIKNTAAALQQDITRKRIRSRMAVQLLRISAGFSVLLPWLFGLAGLALLESSFKQYQLVLLLPLIPFGRLYILYGLIRLFGEWYLNRINERAGIFLTPAQSRSIRNRSRLAAATAMLPLLIHDFVGLAIGPSLLLTYLLWIMLGSVFAAISLLLLSYREIYIRALQSFLPEAIDPWIERILTPGLMPLLGPLFSPILLVAMLITFVHRALVDFDWYRKLIARSFKLRSATPDKDMVNDSDAAALEQYQQWFGDTLQDQDLPIIKVELLKSLQDIVSPWLQNQSEENSLLLSGQRGSGKSVALDYLSDCLQQEHPEIVLRTVNVPPKSCSTTAVSELLATALGDDRIDGPGALVNTDSERQPTIVVLEDAQNFFLREVGLLDGWETLLSFTKARVSNIFWIVVINNQSWAYLSRVFGGDYQFSHVARTRAWSQNEIRSLILSRHQLSNFKIRYDDILLSTRGPEAGSVRNAEQLYFSLLWDSCGGNPLLALNMWLSSVKVYGKTVTVGLPAEMPTASLEHLSEEMHFVYAALVIHENLSSEELTAVTSLSQSIVRAALKTAFDLGLINRAADRRYRIMPMWYPAISKLLTRKNLLHE